MPTAGVLSQIAWFRQLAAGSRGLVRKPLFPAELESFPEAFLVRFFYPFTQPETRNLNLAAESASASASQPVDNVPRP
jgi:hypothetical protein